MQIFLINGDNGGSTVAIEIKGKVALVTGANRGIGKAIVESFMAHGAAKVYAAVRKVSSANVLVAEYGDKIVPVKVDLSEPASITRLAENATDVQILVNNAGVLTVTGPLDDSAEESLQYELDINLFGLLRMAQAFVPVLEANGSGAIVQLNSVSSLKNFGNASTYSVSKAASYSLTQGLRDALAGKGIVVLSVHPGPIATDMANDAGIGDYAESPSLVAEGIVTALRDGAFHVFPDSMAKELERYYRSYAESVIES